MAIAKSGSNILRVAGGGGILRTTTGDPYPWYTDLDRNTIPFHQAAGTWGIQEALVAPTAPNATNPVTCTTAAQVRTAAQTPGNLITVTVNVGELDLTGFDLTDIIIRLNDNVEVAGCRYGSNEFSGDFDVTRFRIQGETLGQYGGAKIYPYLYGVTNAPTTSHSDVHFDGIAISGDNDTALGPVEPFYTEQCDRMAVTNCLGLGGQKWSTTAGLTHFVVAGCNIASGNDTTIAQPERWTIRTNGPGPFVFFRNRIESLSSGSELSYHRIRISPILGGGHTYIWGDQLMTVDNQESLGVWVDRVESNGPTDQVTAAWYSNCINYLRGITANGDQRARSWALEHIANYARAINNTFYGDVRLTDLQGNQASTEAADADFTTGCTFNAWQAPPAWTSLPWTSPGDPTGLPY